MDLDCVVRSAVSALQRLAAHQRIDDFAALAALLSDFDVGRCVARSGSSLFRPLQRQVG